MFTLFGGLEALQAFEAVLRSLEECGQVIYVVYQVEECPTTGRPHIQGYVEFTNAKTMSAVKSCLRSTRVNLQPRRAECRSQARAYCMKPDSRVRGPYEIGNYRGAEVRGKRNDLLEMYESMESGMAPWQLLDKFKDRYLRYSRMCDVYYKVKLSRPRPFRDVFVAVLVGTPGLGKTRAVLDRFPLGDVYSPLTLNGALWFDGYTGQPVLLLDDFYGGIIRYSELLRLLDGYQIQLPVKGASTYSNWSCVFITSNSSPRSWYSKDSVPDISALERRIDRDTSADSTWDPETGERKVDLSWLQTQQFYEGDRYDVSASGGPLLRVPQAASSDDDSDSDSEMGGAGAPVSSVIDLTGSASDDDSDMQEGAGFQTPLRPEVLDLTCDTEDSYDDEIESDIDMKTPQRKRVRLCPNAP